MLPTEIHILGDSLARGIVYQELRGRYAISRQRCSGALETVLGAKVADHSKMGATTDDGLLVLEALPPVPDGMCAIEFGGNDCDLDWAYVAEHPEESVRAKVPLDRFEEQLRRLVGLARVREMQPVLVSPLPLHAGRYFAWVTRGLNADNVLRALGDVQAIYRWQERYAITVARVSRELGTPLFDMRDVFLARQREYEGLMCVDGIHPNDEGHRIIAQAAVEAARARYLGGSAQTA